MTTDLYSALLAVSTLLLGVFCIRWFTSDRNTNSREDFDVALEAAMSQFNWPRKVAEEVFRNGYYVTTTGKRFKLMLWDNGRMSHWELLPVDELAPQPDTTD
jgi:hypothetical protein